MVRLGLVRNLRDKMQHTKDQKCNGCQDKLLGVHLALVDWFNWLKWNHPEVHICWGWRGKEEQHKAFLDGQSKADWPNSKHNNMLDGIPCSLALDIFTIDDKNIAHFSRDFYERVATETENEGYPIRWGGTFAHLKDLDHFELVSNPIK